jgi:hypothetical protein
MQKIDDAKHLPAWVKFNKKAASSDDVGVMPRFGLAKAGTHSVLGRKLNTAKDRLAKKQGDK